MNFNGTSADDLPVDSYMHGGDHYLRMGVEPWNVIDTWPQDQRIGFYRGCALKYVMRLGSKDDALQESKKAHHYLTKLIEVLEDQKKSPA